MHLLRVKYFWREHGEEIKDDIKIVISGLAIVIIGNCLTPPEFLRVAIWKWITWTVLK